MFEINKKYKTTFSGKYLVLLTEIEEVHNSNSLCHGIYKNQCIVFTLNQIILK